MTTVLAVLTLWTLLGTATAAGFCLVFTGVRREEERECSRAAARAVAPPAVAAALPRPRRSSEQAARLRP